MSPSWEPFASYSRCTPSVESSGAYQPQTTLTSSGHTPAANQERDYNTNASSTCKDTCSLRFEHDGAPKQHVTGHAYDECALNSAKDWTMEVPLSTCSPDHNTMGFGPPLPPAFQPFDPFIHSRSFAPPFGPYPYVPYWAGIASLAMPSSSYPCLNFPSAYLGRFYATMPHERSSDDPAMRGWDGSTTPHHFIRGN